mgnify:CR=1 FL=1
MGWNVLRRGAGAGHVTKKVMRERGTRSTVCPVVSPGSDSFGSFGGAPDCDLSRAFRSDRYDTNVPRRSPPSGAFAAVSPAGVGSFSRVAFGSDLWAHTRRGS